MSDGDVKTRQDIRGWFAKPNEDALLKLIQENGIKTVIEIGSFLGASTAFFAEHCEHVFAIDPFVIWEDFIKDGQPRGDLPDNFFPVFQRNMELLDLTRKVTPYVMTSREAALDMPSLRADLIYIDGGHDYDSVLTDILAWLPRAEKFICGDDFDEHWPGVKEAVTSQFDEFEIIGNNVWVKKI